MESNKLSEQGSKIDLNQHYLRVIHTRFSLSGWLVFEKKIFLKVQTQPPPPPAILPHLSYQGLWFEQTWIFLPKDVSSQVTNCLASWFSKRFLKTFLYIDSYVKIQSPIVIPDSTLPAEIMIWTTWKNTS